MKILFLGDIVGRAGRDIVFKHLNQLQKDYDIDFTIVNAENSAHGKGISTKIYNSLINNGVDCITMGNHTYSKGEIKTHMEDFPKMVVPYNHIIQLHQGYKTFNVNGHKLCVVNLLGSALMSENNCDPFVSMKRILNKTNADMYFVDLHAEATSEKMLFANYFKNQCVAVIGTHTHVQTADERLYNGCAYLSDVGMCGVYDSIIGRDTQEMIDKLINHFDTRYTIAEGEGLLCACVIEIDDTSLRATKIERIQIRPE